MRLCLSVPVLLFRELIINTLECFNYRFYILFLRYKFNNDGCFQNYCIRRNFNLTILLPYQNLILILSHSPLENDLRKIGTWYVHANRLSNDCFCAYQIKDVNLNSL